MKLIKTDSGTTRLEIGKYDSTTHHIRYYHTDSLVLYFSKGSDGIVELHLGQKASADFSHLNYSGLAVKDVNNYLRAGIYKGEIYLKDSSNNITFQVDANVKTTGVYKVGANRVVGARKAAVANPGALTGVQAIGGSDSINIANLNALFSILFTELGAWYTCMNAIRDRLRVTGGHGLTAD